MTLRAYQASPASHHCPTNLKMPSKGKLRWISGNLGFDYPVFEEVLDCGGNVRWMGLAELLQRLDDFEGTRCGMPMNVWHITVCFSAYEHGQLSTGEREIFEAFVRERIGTMPPVEIAKHVMVSALWSNQ